MMSGVKAVGVTLTILRKIGIFVGYILGSIAFILVLGFFAAPEYCSGRFDSRNKGGGVCYRQASVALTFSESQGVAGR